MCSRVSKKIILFDFIWLICEIVLVERWSSISLHDRRNMCWSRYVLNDFKTFLFIYFLLYSSHDILRIHHRKVWLVIYFPLHASCLLEGIDPFDPVIFLQIDHFYYLLKKLFPSLTVSWLSSRQIQLYFLIQPVPRYEL